MTRRDYEKELAQRDKKIAEQAERIERWEAELKHPPELLEGQAAVVPLADSARPATCVPGPCAAHRPGDPDASVWRGTGISAPRVKRCRSLATRLDPESDAPRTFARDLREACQSAGQTHGHRVHVDIIIVPGETCSASHPFSQGEFSDKA